MENKNVILEMSFAFALDIINYCEELERQRKYVLARQLLKSGTAIGANVREAQSSESRMDFIHKLKISYKEALETEYWLLLCEQSSSYPEVPKAITSKMVSIKKLLNSIIATSKNNNRK